MPSLLVFACLDSVRPRTNPKTTTYNYTIGSIIKHVRADACCKHFVVSFCWMLDINSIGCFGIFVVGFGRWFLWVVLVLTLQISNSQRSACLLRLFFFFGFQNKVSRCSPGYPGTQAGLELKRYSCRLCLLSAGIKVVHHNARLVILI